jgi:hypothetical protein
MFLKKSWQNLDKIPQEFQEALCQDLGEAFTAFLQDLS